MTLGQKIRNFRVDKGLCVKAFAKELGYSDYAVSSWEKNKIVPNKYALEDLSFYMGISVDELMKGVDER